jgi:hypothetical protein
VDVDATVTAAVIESGVGAEIGNAKLRGGLVTGLPRHHVSLESASETRSVITIVNGTVLESEKKIGIGLPGVVVRTAARVVRAAAAAAVVAVVVADTVESTATGHWPREWDSDIFLSSQNNVGTDLHELMAT